MKPWLKKQWCIGQVDGEYIAKMEQVLTVADPTRPRLCFDERPCQLLDDVVAPLSMQPDKPIKEDNEYVRQGTAVVLLAYDGTGHPAG